MEFEWTPAQRALHDEFRKLGEDKLNNIEPELAARERFRRAAWTALGDADVLALPVPPEHGGPGYDALTCAFALEGLGYGCRDLGLLISAGAHMWAVELPLLRFGTPAQRDRYLPGLASGKIIGAHAITETNAGSDALSLESTARRDGPAYVLRGRKRFVTNAMVADVFLVYATIDSRLGFSGVTAFVVDHDQRGLRVEAEVEKMGLRSSPWAQVVLDDCVVPEGQRLGSDKQGSRIFATVMAWERTLLLAPLLGAMARQVDNCAAYAKSRRQFGHRIAAFQSVSNRIVDMHIRLETARLLSYRAASDLAGCERSAFPEIAKLYLSEAAIATFQDAVQVLGTRGYTTATDVERGLRDVLGTRISSGTSDLQRWVIAAKLGLR
jgi:L-prolyl-PCP dehydrogenase